MGCSQNKSCTDATGVVHQQSSSSIPAEDLLVPALCAPTPIPVLEKEPSKSIKQIQAQPRTGTGSKSDQGSEIFSGQGSSYTEQLPVEEVVRPRKKKISRQASGHGGLNFVKQYAGKHDFKTGVPEFILKAFDPEELKAYEELASSGDEFGSFVATCCGQVTALDGAAFLKLSNLLATLQRRPHVMDCKIGVRSFTEGEVSNTKVRQDLYLRAIALDPKFPTEEERAMQACTKYRWMSFNDQLTTLSDLGLRIDGLTNSAGQLSKAVLHRPRSLTEIAHCIIEHFLIRSEDEDELSLSFMQEIATSLRTQLQELLQRFKTSKFVESHTIVGSSLLFAVDACGSYARVFWIDIAKSQPLPPGIQITHDSKWVQGNHEDGLFLGVENMISCWEEVERLLEEEASPFRAVV